MNSRSFRRASVACAVLAVTVSTSAEAQLGAVRRAAQRAVTGAAPGTTAQPTSPTAPAPSASSAISGDVLEMNGAVLDRFHRALEAQAADLAGIAQRLGAMKSPEEYMQCQVTWYQSPAGQAEYAKLTAATESGDYARMTAVALELKAALERVCGLDESERDRIRQEAPAHAEEAALAAGEFNARQFAVIKERMVPFCRAAASLSGDGEVRLPGDGRGIFWVYTAAEAAALRERCAPLMQAMSRTA